MSTSAAAGRLHVGDVELAYEVHGDPGDPPVVLVMGLGGQLTYWHDDFVAELVARGLQVVRFDNRDVGLSTHLSGTGAVDLTQLSADRPPPYTLEDMADDVAGLIAGLGFGSAHVVGMSLGGFISQTVAISHPERVRSLTSIASTTGNPAVGQSRPHALEALFTPPPDGERATICEHAVKLSRVIGSPGFELDEAWFAERAGRSYDRYYDPQGVVRQTAAIAVAHDRTGGLRELSVPALVIHGRDDPLVELSGGEATAAAIPGAELLIIDGMGHDLPRPVWPTIADAIARTVRRAGD